MTRIGYGLLRVDNQQPIGIWPLPLDECTYGDPVANEKTQTFAGRAK
ncbi:MAG: hypothetical protein IPK64_19975 [bacterium]|nr:hypothetical protein [bacterium]